MDGATALGAPKSATHVNLIAILIFHPEQLTGVMCLLKSGAEQFSFFLPKLFPNSVLLSVDFDLKLIKVESDSKCWAGISWKELLLMEKFLQMPIVCIMTTVWIIVNDKCAYQSSVLWDWQQVLVCKYFDHCWMESFLFLWRQSEFPKRKVMYVLDMSNTVCASHSLALLQTLYNSISDLDIFGFQKQLSKYCSVCMIL